MKNFFKWPAKTKNGLSIAGKKLQRRFDKIFAENDVEAMIAYLTAGGDPNLIIKVVHKEGDGEGPAWVTTEEVSLLDEARYQAVYEKIFDEGRSEMVRLLEGVGAKTKKELEAPAVEQAHLRYMEAEAKAKADREAKKLANKAKVDAYLASL